MTPGDVGGGASDDPDCASAMLQLKMQIHVVVSLLVKQGKMPAQNIIGG